MILCSLRFFIVSHVVFSTVGAEMLTGDSVGVGWDQLEWTGPKEDRQVTLGMSSFHTMEMGGCSGAAFIRIAKSKKASTKAFGGLQ